MAVCLGSMQYVLEEGNKKDWLDDFHILLLTIIVIITFIWLIIREITYQNPIIDLSSFKNKNFSFFELIFLAVQFENNLIVFLSTHKKFFVNKYVARQLVNF